MPQRALKPRRGRRLVTWALAATLCAAAGARAHTRSQSHSVWEINGADVDLVLTIPVVEADRLANDQGAPSDERVIVKYAIAASGKTAIDMPAPKEHIKADTSASAGTLDVDLAAYDALIAEVGT